MVAGFECVPLKSKAKVSAWNFYDLTLKITVSLWPYCTGKGRHKGQPRFKGKGHRYHILNISKDRL